MNECSSDGEHLTMRCCPLSVVKVGQHFYFIAISNRCCYKILNDKLQYNHLRVDEGGTHHIGVEEGGGSGRRSLSGSGVDAFGVGGADRILVGRMADAKPPNVNPIMIPTIVVRLASPNQ
jgi:hypothetical protein